MELKEITLSEETVYECPVFKVTQAVVSLPDGNVVGRNKILHNGGSGVLPLSESGEVILVEQFRSGIEKITLEIPAGKLEVGEDPAVCAKRELEEEVGGKADQLIPLGTIAVTPAYDSEIIYIYMAECNEFSQQHLDDDEFLRIHSLPFEEALQMVMNGEIIDAKTQIALLKASELKRDKNMR